MAYDPNSLLDANEQSRRNMAFMALENLLCKTAPHALDYDVVMAEGNGGAVPAAGAASLVTVLREILHMSQPETGHIKSTSGPNSIYPEVPIYSGPSPKCLGRCLLITEVIYRGVRMQEALQQLRLTLPLHTPIDVAVIANGGGGGLGAIRAEQMPQERLIVGGGDYLSTTAGDYFWNLSNAKKPIEDDLIRATQLGKTVAERFLRS